MHAQHRSRPSNQALRRFRCRPPPGSPRASGATSDPAPHTSHITATPALGSLESATPAATHTSSPRRGSGLRDKPHRADRFKPGLTVVTELPHAKEKRSGFLWNAARKGACATGYSDKCHGNAEQAKGMLLHRDGSGHAVKGLDVRQRGLNTVLGNGDQVGQQSPKAVTRAQHKLGQPNFSSRRPYTPRNSGQPNLPHARSAS